MGGGGRDTILCPLFRLVRGGLLFSSYISIDTPSPGRHFLFLLWQRKPLGEGVCAAVAVQHEMSLFLS